jgi:hypothetical protein
MIHLWVKDDGVGITAEDLTRVFERGFSRKGGLARGLGLHWCANSVAGMKGRMSAESDGPGQGRASCVVSAIGVHSRTLWGRWFFLVADERAAMPECQTIRIWSRTTKPRSAICI